MEKPNHHYYRDQILYIMNMLNVMGGNDSEIPEIYKIINMLDNGKIKGEEALRMAQSIFDKKVDYH